MLYPFSLRFTLLVFKSTQNSIRPPKSEFVVYIGELAVFSFVIFVVVTVADGCDARLVAATSPSIVPLRTVVSAASTSSQSGDLPPASILRRDTAEAASTRPAF